ncbi:unnamed protein product [Brassica rapa]|uniref:Uncharacterized protein n=1 Tax=Brassica campestris TaxID=3711 RepID=A0A3P5YN62_BRACM|nr:unnamed protein product [Brassica rapa]VDC69177.1 unnamed protein product [Brassica rapa]
MPCLSNKDPKNKSKLGKNNRDVYASPATPTSSKTSSSPPTANPRFLEAGTASFASRISPPTSRLADSSDTPKTSSLWPSRSTTVR